MLTKSNINYFSKLVIKHILGKDKYSVSYKTYVRPVSKWQGGRETFPFGKSMINQDDDYDPHSGDLPIPMFTLLQNLSCDDNMLHKLSFFKVKLMI